MKTKHNSRPSAPRPAPLRAHRWPILAATCLLLGGLALPAQPVTNNPIKPVPLPDPQIRGYHFPERESTILGWIQQSGLVGTAQATNGLKAIALHGWGLWTALTSETDQVVEAQKLRVFETWYTPEEVADLGPQTLTGLRGRVRGRSPLRTLRQFGHSASTKAAAGATKAAPVVRATGFVKYDPTAADHIAQQQLFAKATLNSLLTNGANAIPPFPTRAISLKPVFELITSNLVVNGRYYPLKVWTGPPTVARAYGEDAWPGVVWVDVKGGGAGKGAVDMNAGTNFDGSTRTEATTYPASSFIHYQLSEADAADLNTDPESGVTDAAAGDFSILLAMHVTSKEVTRWTWQTFWWTPNPEVGIEPSSSLVVTARPEKLQGPARHYAMSIGYATETPAQPNVGGSNIGNSVYAYNPYLEAGFGPDSENHGRSRLPDSKPGLFQGQVVANTFGVQTSCLSCHANANYTPTPVPTAPTYTGDQYIDLNSPRFANVLKVDFLWSIPGNAK